MKTLRRQCAAVIVAFAALFSNANGEDVSIVLQTYRAYVPEGGTSHMTFEIYDQYGVLYLTGAYPFWGYQGYTETFWAAALPAGSYSFALQADGYTYWTELVDVTGGYSGTISAEAFVRDTMPVLPAVVPIAGSLLVEGNIDMEGSRFNLGKNLSDPQIPAFSIEVPAPGYVQRNIASAPNYMWTWEGPSGSMQFSTWNGPKLYINGSDVLTTAGSGTQYLPAQPIKMTIGSGVVASGANSFASGNTVTASGTHAGAFGLGTTAQGYNQFVVGQYNTALGTSASNNNPSDPLFIVGNGTGTSSGQRSNAFVVKRNGDAEIRGKLIVGAGAHASGVSAFAVGENADAGGDSSIALGASTSAGIQAIAMGFAAQAQPGSIALGAESNSFGDDAVSIGRMAVSEARGVAIGNAAFAYGNYSVSIGDESYAGGASSVAVGAFAYAEGENALALGWSNTATGIGSKSMGLGSHSSGFASTSIGRSTTAQGLNQFVIGSFNITSGAPHNSWNEFNSGFPTWNPNDEIFIIGNGVAENSRSNALIVKKNAATGIGTGVVTTTASQTVVGRYNDSSVGGLFVVGMGSGTGTTPRKNAIRVREDGTLLVRPSGDLSMGSFESGEQP